MLSTLATMFGGKIVDSLMGQATQLFTAYIQKKITEEELRAGMVRALTQAFADVEKAYAESVAKTYASFMEAASKSRTIQIYFVAVGFSQLAVLLWHQLGIPAVKFMTGVNYPSSGATVDWAYALVTFSIGGGAYAFRSAGGGMVEKLRDMVGRKK